MSCRNRIFYWIPSIISSRLLPLLPARYGWFGRYRDWHTLRERTTGYDDDAILERVKEATLRVAAHPELFERDSVVFTRPDYQYPLLSGLFLAAAHAGGELHLVDFGGALGSGYFQNRLFFSFLKTVGWHVVEQPQFAACGREHFAGPRLTFHISIEEALRQDGKINAILFSSVLQYLEKPYEFLASVLNFGLEFILIDRTPFVLRGADRLTKQVVPPSIYHASYPCWFFNKQSFLKVFSGRYELVDEFASLDRARIHSEFRGFVFRRSDSRGTA